MPDKKRVMFIGAGAHQLKGIERAKELGLFIVASDGSEKAAGLKLADKPYVVDVKDEAANIKIAKENDIDGVVTIASEVSVRTVAAVAKELHLPGINPEVAARCTDKGLMREAFYQHQVPSPKSFPIFKRAEVDRAIKESGYPFVIKPADNAGSRGVKMVVDLTEVNEAYDQALSNSRSGKVLIEEFLDGVEVSVEAFVQNDEIHIITLSDKIRTDPPYLLDTAVLFPSKRAEAEQQRIIEVAVKAIKAIGIDIGPVHMELMMTKKGPVPVELAVRGPGFKVFTDIMPMITGIDLVGAQIKVSLGETPDLKRTKDLAAVIKFFEAKEGRVKRITGLPVAQKMAGVYELELYVKVGEKTCALTCGADRIGHVITIADTREEAERIAGEAEKAVGLEIEPEGGG